jgi:hypothetical protein
MRDLDPAGVAMADRVSGAGDGLDDAESAARAPDERGFSRAQLAGDRDYIAREQPVCNLRRKGLGLLGRTCLDFAQNSPSCTATGSASGSTRGGSNETAGPTSRSSSAGIRLKSSSSTLSIAGVYSAAAGW